MLERFLFRTSAAKDALDRRAPRLKMKSYLEEDRVARLRGDFSAA